ncbi:MAG: hypothetical protein V7745_07060 [Pseudomonadales bacterium]
MAWVATAVVVGVTAGSAYLQSEKEKEARDKAEDDAEDARLEAIRAEQFAEEEGKGQGQLGKISLALDDELEDELNQKTTL